MEFIDEASLRICTAILKEHSEKVKEKAPNLLKKFFMKNSNCNQETEVDTKAIIDKKYANLVGTPLQYISPSTYNQLEKLHEQPNFVNQTPNIARILPFIMQKIKMWGCNALISEKMYTVSSNGKSAADKSDSDDEDDEPLNFHKLDIFATLIASAEDSVLEDIFRLVAMFPISLPLVLPDFKSTTMKHRMLVPELHKCLIKWDNRDKKSESTFLFTNPFKLILALRTSRPDNCTSSGKSVFLNQLFQFDNMFHCNGQLGRMASNLPGIVEFTWLTEDTCKPAVWETIKSEVLYVGSEKSPTNEVCLLANFHGDALEHDKALKYVTTLTSTFIIFVMPDEAKKQKASLAKLANVMGEKSSIYFYIDPKESKNLDRNQVLRSQYVANAKETLNKLKKGIKSGIAAEKAVKLDLNVNSPFFTPSTAKESVDFVNYISELCEQKKENSNKDNTILKLQKLVRENVISKYEKEWKQNGCLRNLMAKFVRILELPIENRRISLSHIERELSVLSDITTSTYSAKLADLGIKRQNLYNNNTKTDELQEIEIEIDRLHTELRNSLTLEDFFRELALVYEMMTCVPPTDTLHQQYTNLPIRYAELLWEGRPIEILDGDMGCVPFVWLNAVCHSVCAKQPHMKVFVVSILGLQSSGKSTLLNALFGCKFPTSMGKCTKGLYMRLMPLEKSFKEELKLDAILVIDTEGLGSPNNAKPLDGNSDSETRDRAMATFAMAISDLTLINVNGESYAGILNILQIVILIMAKMDEADISPDILLVQRVSEGGQEEKLAEGVKEFCKALEEAIQIVRDKGLEFEVKTLNNLEALKSRIQQREILCPLRNFKGATPQAAPTEYYHQDVVSLRRRIIRECESKGKKYKSFCGWHELLDRYWSTVQKEKFAEFDSINQVQDFIEVNSKMKYIQTNFEKALLFHEEKCLIYINRKLYSSDLKQETHSDMEVETEIRENLKKYLDNLPYNCGQNEVNNILSGSLCFSCDITKRAVKDLNDFLSTTQKSKTMDPKTELSQFFPRSIETLFQSVLSRYKTEKLQRKAPNELDEILTGVIQEHKKNSFKQPVNGIWNDFQGKVKVIYPVPDIEHAFIDDVRKKIKDATLTLAMLNTSPFLDATNAIRSKFIFKKDFDEDDIHELRYLIHCAAVSSLKLSKEKKIGYSNSVIDNFKKELPTTVYPLTKHHALTGDFEKQMWTYGAHILYIEAKKLQAEWNNSNNIYCMLIAREDEYIQKIKLSVEPEIGKRIENIAIAMAKKLIKAAESTSKQVTLMEILGNFKELNVSPGQLRVQYFVDMLTGLDDDTHPAVKYFQNPRKEITAWYKEMIRTTFMTDLQTLLDKIFGVQYSEIEKSVARTRYFDDLAEYVNNYCHQNENFNFFHDSFTDKHKTYLKDKVLAMLNEQKRQISNVKIPKKDLNDYLDFFMDNLGCTEICPNCGAICFNTKGHSNYHFTCHQPKGFIGIPIEGTNELDLKSCDDESLKNNDFDNPGNNKWLPKKHLPEAYANLMQLIFLKLNYTLAKNLNLKPASKVSLESKKFHTLENRRQDILSTIINHSQKDNFSI